MASLTESGNMQQARRRTSGTPLRLDDMPGVSPVTQSPTPVKPAASNTGATANMPKPNPTAGYQQNVAKNRQGLEDLGNSVGGAVADTANMLGGALYGAATLRPIRRAISNTTVSPGLPDYGQQERRDAAKKFIANNPEQAASGNQFADDVSGRAVNRIQERMSVPNALTQTTAPEGQQTESIVRRQPGAAAGQAGEAQGSQTSAAAPSADPLTTPPPNSWNKVGNGIAGRRNAQGVAEFTDSPETLAGAGDGKVKGLADGIGGLSVVSGGREAMNRNLLATAIMRQTRLENTNPNYVTTVRDPNASGMQGLINQKLDRQDAQQRNERTAQQQDRVAAGEGLLVGLQSQLDQNVQARIANERNNRSANRLDDLSGALANPNLPADQRAKLERTMGSLTVSAKDRYVPQDTILDYDLEGKPIVGRTALDVLTGSLVGQESQSAPEGLTSSGMTFAGTYNGNKVYRDASGKMFVDE